MNSKPMEVTKARNANYKLKDVAKLFSPGLPEAAEGTCGNIRRQIEGDTWRGSIGESTSAPYLLARLCALFEDLRIQTSGQSGYKCTWATVLVHPETGHVVTFYDYKGSAAFGSDVYGKNAPKAFIRDLKKLIRALKDDRCPHPYDGCVVGEVA